MKIPLILACLIYSFIALLPGMQSSWEYTASGTHNNDQRGSQWIQNGALESLGWIQKRNFSDKEVPWNHVTRQRHTEANTEPQHRRSDIWCLLCWKGLPLSVPFPRAELLKVMLWQHPFCKLSLAARSCQFLSPLFHFFTWYPKLKCIISEMIIF